MKLKNLNKAIARRANGVSRDISKQVRAEGRAITNTGAGLRHEAKQAYVSGLNRGKAHVGQVKARANTKLKKVRSGIKAHARPYHSIA
jgi:hypothetical protein